jgi:[acyl-carrier-protein] S-malonyltransferase
MKLAFLFSGQGSQTVGMGSTLAACNGCREILAAADRALGFRLSRVMAEGPEEKLRRTAITQPAVLTISVAHALHLKSLGIVPDVLVGHSLGQYAALVFAGSLQFESAVQLVAQRGQLMQESVPENEGAMLAIVALERELVYAACEAVQTKGTVSVACHNSPGQTVISGARAAVNAAADWCEDKGGGVVPLAVSVPFHCRMLSRMVPEFTGLLKMAGIADPMLPVIDNVSARPLLDACSVQESLVAQLTAPVLFEESMNYLLEMGVRQLVQCGPGKSLLNFAKRIDPTLHIRTCDESAAGASVLQNVIGEHHEARQS